MLAETDIGVERALSDRELAAERLALRLDRPIGYLGIFALALWWVEPFTNERHALSFLVDGLWAVVALSFVVEFGARLIAARNTWTFVRDNWWEVGLIALPFLRFLRVARAARAARGMAAAVRSGHRAAQQLQSRITWLVIVTAVVALSSARLLFEYGGYDRSYGDAIHDAAMATLTGSTFHTAHAFARALGVVLAAYSAVIIATIAGSVGAYFVSEREKDVQPAP